MGILLKGDCLEIMPQLEPVDLVLTDPPYGIGEARNHNESRGLLAESKAYPIESWDDNPPPPEYFEMIQKYSTNQIIFGGNYFVEWLKNSPCWIVWDKDNGKTDFADCELAWTSFVSATRLIKWRWQGMLQEFGGINKEVRYHRNQKPVGLFMQLLNRYSKETDLICDTHLGSGTTAIACERLMRKWIGIEISLDYCKIAKERIQRELSQPRLPFGF